MNKPQKSGAWFWRIVLTLVGAALLWVTLAPVGWWLAARDWVETPARLLSVGMKVEREENSTRHRVTARYEYEWDGVKQVGTRVLLPAMKGPFDRRDWRKHAELEALKKAGGQTVCFVNPRVPVEAVLDRSLRYEHSLFGLALLAIASGFWIVFHYNRLKWRGGVDPALQARHPAEPWRWNRAWRAGRIGSEKRYQLGETIGGGLAIGGFGGVFAANLAFGERSNLLIGLCILFGLLLAFFVYGVVGSILRWRRFGDSTFRLAGPTGVVGGRLAGEVDAPRQLLDAEPITLRLYCAVTRIVRSGDSNNSEKEDVVWEREQSVTPRRDGNRAVLPVDFVVPSSAPPTRREEKRLATWRLAVKAKLPGPDFGESFVVPVFETPDSQPNITVEKPPEPTHALEEQFDDATTLDQRLAGEGVRVEPLPGAGVRYFAPAGRNRRDALGLTVAAFVWNGVLGGIGYAVYAYADWGATIFWIVAACALWVLVLLGPALIVAAIHAWMVSEELTIDGDRWRTRIGWWGLPKWRTEFLAGNVRRILLKRGRGNSVRVGNQAEKRSPGSASLYAQVAGANLPRTLFTTLKSRRTAEMLAEELRRRLGDEVEVVTAEGFEEAKRAIRRERDAD